MSGRRKAASGATPWSKEDITNDSYLYQHKDATHQTGHRVEFSALEELRKNAIDEGKDPIYWIETKHRNWYIVPAEQYEALSFISKLP